MVINNKLIILSVDVMLKIPSNLEKINIFIKKFFIHTIIHF